MKAFDFVLVKFPQSTKPYLYHAPAWSCLQKGDQVIVETSHGDKAAIVEACATYHDIETETIDMIMTAAQATPNVKRVLAKVCYSKMDYGEDEE